MGTYNAGEHESVVQRRSQPLPPPHVRVTCEPTVAPCSVIGKLTTAGKHDCLMVMQRGPRAQMLGFQSGCLLAVQSWESDLTSLSLCVCPWSGTYVLSTALRIQ